VETEGRLDVQMRRNGAGQPRRAGACSASVVHIGANAYTLSGQGLVSSSAGYWEPPLSAYRILTPSTVRNWTCGVIVVAM
jgi:hypothetical protein